MIATEIFRANHRTIRRALVTFERALLMQNGRWIIVARNLARYLDLELREYWGSEERMIFQPLAETGPDAAGVVEEMLLGHRHLEAHLTEFTAFSRGEVASATLPLLREKGVSLVKEFLHHMFVEEELGFALAEERLGLAALHLAGDRVLSLKEFERGLEEPAAID
jgi:hypothetical protein